jgi:hypothetical protein
MIQETFLSTDLCCGVSHNLLGFGPIAMAWRLTGRNHASGCFTSVEGLMYVPWGNLYPLAGTENESAMFYLDCQFSFQNEKELTRFAMKMWGFTRAWRHQLLDDA